MEYIKNTNGILETHINNPDGSKTLKGKFSAEDLLNILVAKGILKAGDVAITQAIAEVE